MPETYALYPTDLTDDERELGFELVELQTPSGESLEPPQYAIAYRFSECDQIVKMNVPVIGGYSFRHERLKTNGFPNESAWAPVGAVVFPSASLAVEALARGARLQLCHS